MDQRQVCFNALFSPLDSHHQQQKQMIIIIIITEEEERGWEGEEG